MNNDIPKKIIDITGIDLVPESLPFVLATENKALTVVATSATTFCFVFRNLIQEVKKSLSFWERWQPKANEEDMFHALSKGRAFGLRKLDRSRRTRQPYRV